MEGCCTSCEKGRVNALIKCGQFTSALHGKCKKVEVGEVRCHREVGKRVGSRERKIVGPKLVPGSGSK